MISIDELLLMAKNRGASDVHLTVALPPKARINGTLVSLIDEKLTITGIEDLVAPILNDRTRGILAEYGEVDFAYSIPGEGRFRVNVFKQRGTVATVLRLVNNTIPSPDKLGVPKEVQDLVFKKRGLVLVTGPTGSGKSTTLAAMIDRLNQRRNCHIITLEDPIEYLHSHKEAVVNQREIGADTQSYAGALRAALREDPDVILVGEMRDLDTMATAITAAETGHLVLSTLHTTGAAPTVDRIIDVFPPSQQPQIRMQFANVIEGVISQQLLPNVHNNGRVAAFEVMLGTPAIRNLVRESKTHQINGLIQTSRKQGMVLMDDSLYELYSQGRISKDSLMSYAQDTEAMRKRCFA